MSIATKTTERDVIGLGVVLLAKEIVAPSRRSSAGWMPESIDKVSIGVECRHLVTMREASFRTPSIKSEC